MASRVKQVSGRVSRQGKVDKRVGLIRDYLKLGNQLARHPKRHEMLKMDWNRDAIRHVMGNFTQLVQHVKQHHAGEISHWSDEWVNCPDRRSRLDSDLKRFKRFVITSVIPDSGVNEAFLKSLKVYCTENSAALLLVPAGNLGKVPEMLRDEHWILRDTRLNRNVSIAAGIRIGAKNIKPLTGLSRIGQRSGSMVIGSPKQQLDFTPVGNQKFPHAVFSTGTLSRARYVSGKAKDVKRIDYFSKHDHVTGAVIIEIGSAEQFHFRQVQSNQNGVFFDMGVRYEPNGSQPEAPLAVRFGDLHVGETDPAAYRAGLEMIRELGIKTLFLEDVFTGYSVNHHEAGYPLKRAELFRSGKLLLERELQEVTRVLAELAAEPTLERIYIVHSNHHEFLSRHYLERGLYLKDPYNLELGHRLALAVLQGKDPLRSACEEMFGLKSSKIVWLRPDSDLKIAGVQMAVHGHVGANGSKGSKRTLENGYRDIMHGHTHSPSIFRGVYSVGTTSKLRVGYNEQGPSSWVHCHGLVYRNGSRQLINIFDGSWRLSRSRAKPLPRRRPAQTAKTRSTRPGRVGTRKPSTRSRRLSA